MRHNFRSPISPRAKSYTCACGRPFPRLSIRVQHQIILRISTGTDLANAIMGLILIYEIIDRFRISNFGHCDLPFDLTQGGESFDFAQDREPVERLVEPFDIWDL